MTDLIGQQIGDYRLDRFIGAGGMGEVYVATHMTLERPVAIKVLSADGSRELTDRFVNEARLHARLKHKHIATLYDFLEIGGRPGIVMEFVEGGTLSQRLAARGRLAVGEALAIVTQIAEAAAYVHSKGVVHRDIKSDNIKLTPEGGSKLLDFGIAREHGGPRMTQAGHFVGTMQYCSPEQLSGENVDARSDVWAIGVVLYEMLTGHLPFVADSIGGLLERLQRVDYTRLGVLREDVPASLVSIVERCIAPKDVRYPDAAPLLRDLKRLDPAADQPSFDRALLDLAGGSGRVWVGIGVGAIFAGVVILLLVMPNDTAMPLDEADGAVHAVEPPGFEHARDERLAPVVIDSPTGLAEIWIDGVQVGETPWSRRYPVGTEVEVTLRREGYVDRVARFQVRSLDNAYSYPLHKAR